MFLARLSSKADSKAVSIFEYVKYWSEFKSTFVKPEIRDCHIRNAEFQTAMCEHIPGLIH
jgi:hypothetical protein